ncbi:hypothetical protein HDU83_004815 [Entophlyctis luteolus]|nr:hypothetical protein HDU83_004815 [Entophlyctis luteolus]
MFSQSKRGLQGAPAPPHQSQQRSAAPPTALSTGHKPRSTLTRPAAPLAAMSFAQRKQLQLLQDSSSSSTQPNSLATTQSRILSAPKAASTTSSRRGSAAVAKKGQKPQATIASTAQRRPMPTIHRDSKHFVPGEEFGNASLSSILSASSARDLDASQHPSERRPTIGNPVILRRNTTFAGSVRQEPNIQKRASIYAAPVRVVKKNPHPIPTDLVATTCDSNGHQIPDNQKWQANVLAPASASSAVRLSPRTARKESAEKPNTPGRVLVRNQARTIGLAVLDVITPMKKSDADARRGNPLGPVKDISESKNITEKSPALVTQPDEVYARGDSVTSVCQPPKMLLPNPFEVLGLPIPVPANSETPTCKISRGLDDRTSPKTEAQISEYPRGTTENVSLQTKPILVWKEVDVEKSDTGIGDYRSRRDSRGKLEPSEESQKIQSVPVCVPDNDCNTWDVAKAAEDSPNTEIVHFNQEKIKKEISELDEEERRLLLELMRLEGKSG